MKFSYTHHMPYTGIEKVGQDWPVANKQFSPDEGMRIFRAGIDTKVFAEECGFDWIGNNEHHMSPYGLMPNPNLIGACVAERTSKSMILQSGNIVPIVNPIRVAEEYAMLDMISGGRLVAGFMRGIPHEYVAYNVAPSESYGRMNEAIELIKKAWTEPEPFGWEGEYYQFRAVSIWPKPAQKPHPEIVMSASSEASRQSWMASNTASTAATDSAFDREALLATWDTTSDFFQLSFPLKRNRGNIARAAASVTVSPASKRRHYTLGRWVRLTLRLMGLQAIYQAPRTTKPHPQHRVYPCLLKGLAIDRLNQVWTAYITPYPRPARLPVPGSGSWTGPTRRVLSWRLSNTHDARFCTDALRKPWSATRTKAASSPALEFTATLEDAGVAISMDGRGRCMDNIFIERLWHSLVSEAV